MSKMDITETERALSTVLKNEIKMKNDILWDIYYVVQGNKPRIRLVEILEENEDSMKIFRDDYDGHPQKGGKENEN